MSEIDQIISKEAETDEDLLSGDFCECSHEIAGEHEIGALTGSVKCFGLSYNGTVYSACKCTKISPMKYSIKVKVPDHAEDIQNAA